MIIHGNVIRNLGISVIIPAYPVYAGVGFKLAPHKMPLDNLTIHNPGNGVRVEGAALAEVVGVVLTDEGSGKKMSCGKKCQRSDEQKNPACTEKRGAEWDQRIHGLTSFAC